MKTRNELLKIIGESWFLKDCLNPDSIEGLRKISAVKELRSIGGVGLKESKEACDAWGQGLRYIPDEMEMPLHVAGWIIKNLLRNTDSMNDLERQALEVVSDMACDAIDLGSILDGTGPH